MADRGFLLTPTWRTIDGRPQVMLYATLKGGEPALILDDRARPYFFVRACDADAARRVLGRPTAPAPLRAFDGEPVHRVSADMPDEVPRMREALGEAGVTCLEADVRFASRYLIDRGIRGAFTVEGPWQRRPGVGRVYRNPAIAPTEFTPRLRVLSLDIETSMDGERLYSIAVAGAGGERVFLLRDEPGAAPALPEPVETFGAEGPLLERFLAHVREADPDVLTGWSLPDFDLPAILRYCGRAGLRCELGRGPGEPRIRRDPGFTREARAHLAGRVVLDGLALVRGAFFKLDDYKLETAARAILGRGKLFAPEGRGTQIEASFRDDPAALAAYNLEDARLVMEILDRTGLVELAVRRSLLTGSPIDRVSGQIAAVEGLYLGALRGRARVAPSVEAAAEPPLGEDGAPAALVGGLVLDPVPGLYRNVAVYDFKSLYPSIIRTFNIDPLTFAGEVRPGEAFDPALIRTPGGALFRRGEDGILPALVARLWDERGRARAAGDERGAMAIKILMNSLYGVLGSPASRLFSPPVANAIPLAGQHVIRVAAAAAVAEGRRVLYGDTDSLFVDLGEPDPARAAALAEALRGRIGAIVARSLADDFGVQSFLELALSRVYARLLLPEARGGLAGSKKRYAGLVVGGGVEIVGLEAVRRDTSAVGRRFQRELLERVFHDEPVGPFVRRFVEELRAGRLDAELVYRKALRKPLAAYTKTTPQHVKAARRLGAEAGRVVAYVVTRRGPEPVGVTTAPPDYEHYVTHQLRPIAGPILHGIGGPDFDDLIGAKRQLSLF